MPYVGELRRDDEGKLPAFAFPGGYPIVYFTRDGLMVCPDCANIEDTSDPVVSYDIYWEGPTVPCDDCGRDVIESAYGDPDEEADNG